MSTLNHVRRNALALSLCSLAFLASCGTAATSTTSAFTLTGNLVTEATPSTLVRQAVTPSSVVMKVFSLAVSTDEFCSDPITIFSNDEATEVELADNPTLGTGEVPDGTYPCIIIEASDTFRYTPSATEGACVQDEEASKGVCQDDEILFIDGTQGQCTTGEDRVALYLSTANTIVSPEDYDAAGCDTGTDCNGFVPPTSETPTRGGNLGAALVVDGDSAGTLVVTLANGVEEVNDEGTLSCSIEDVRFTFE